MVQSVDKHGGPDSTLTQEEQTGPGASGEPDETFWRSRSWWGRAGHTAFGVWAANALSILGTVIAARALGPGEYGSVMLAIAVVTLVSTFLDVTLEEAAVFHGSRARASGDLGGLTALLRMSLRVDIGIGVLVSGAIVALAGPLADVAGAGELDPTLVRIAALSVLVTTADSTFGGALILARRVDLRARSMAATSAFRLVAVIVAVQLGGAVEVTISYVLGGVAGSLVLARLAWRAGWREWNSVSVSAPAPVGTWELVRFGFHSSLTTTVAAVYGSLVPVLLGRTAGPTAVGLFRAAMLPVVAANNLSGPVRLLMFPEQARLAAEGRIETLRRSVKLYTVIGFALGLCGAVVAYIALPWFIPLLYSPSFDAAVLPARILLIAAVFYFALSWGKTLAAAVGKPQIRTVLAAVELAVVALLLLGGLSDRGAEGAAIAVSAGSVAVGVAWLIIAPRLFRGQLLTESHRTPP